MDEQALKAVEAVSELAGRLFEAASARAEAAEARVKKLEAALHKISSLSPPFGPADAQSMKALAWSALEAAR